jgi:hypothetical protein
MPAALAALAVSAALGAALAELVRTEVVLAEHRRTAAVALAAADGCLAELLAGLPAGWDFLPLLAGPDGHTGTVDDGTLVAPASCAASVRPAPGAADPPRILMQIEGRADGGRRTLDAVVGRTAAPGVPALLWLDAVPAAGALAGAVTLDGGDPEDPTAPAWSAVAAPADPEALDRWLSGEPAAIVATAATTPPIAAPSPPLAALAGRVRGAGPRGAETLTTGSAPPPVLALVDGDLVVADARRGAGLLFVDGTLDIQGTLDFTGVVVASRGLRVAAGGSLTIAGAFWLGLAAAPDEPMRVDGGLALGQRRSALTDADRLLTLPRLPTLLGMRDL